MIRTRTVAYLRVSLEKQADRGVSLEAQRAKVQAYAALYDLESSPSRQMRARRRSRWTGRRSIARSHC